MCLPSPACPPRGRRRLPPFTLSALLLLFVPLLFLLLTPAPASAQAPFANICDRTEAVQEEIFRALGSVSLCALITVDRLAEITDEIDLDGLTSLQDHDFEGLTALTTLRVNGDEDGRLTSLPPGVFDDLTSLTFLSLENNLLSTLPPDLFYHLTSLEELRLGNNRLTSIPSGIFERLTVLHSLYLDNNHFTTLPPGSFRGISLEELTLQNNRFDGFPPGLFTGIAGLGTITFLEQQGDSADELSFTVTLEALPDARGVAVRIAEGAPAASRLTLDIGGSRRTLTIPIGADEVTREVTAPRGTEVELQFGNLSQPEFILGRDSGWDFSVARQTVTLADGIGVSIERLSDVVMEGSPVGFQVTASEAPTQALLVTVDVSGDVIAADAGERTLTIDAGGTETGFTVTTDEVSGGHGAVTAAVRAGAGYEVALPSVAVATVEDGDIGSVTGPAITLSASADRVREGGTVTFTVTASEMPAAPLSVMVDVSGDVVTADAKTHTVTIETGEASATVDVSARTDDDLFQGIGAMTAVVRGGTGYAPGATPAAVVAVWDDEQAPTRVKLTMSETEVMENTSPETITVTAEVLGAPFSDDVVAVDVTLTTLGRTGALEVNPATFSLEIGAGQATTTRDFTLTTAGPGEDTWEGDGTVRASGTARARSAGSTLTVEDATLSVRDSDTVALNVGGAGLTALADGNGVLRFEAAESSSVVLTADLTGPPSDQVDFMWRQDPNDELRVVVEGVETDAATLSLDLPDRSARYTANLTVTATYEPGGGLPSRTESEEVAVEVNADDDLPVIGELVIDVGGATPASPAEVAAGTSVLLQGSATHADTDQVLTVEWSNSQGVPLNPALTGDPGQVIFTAPDEPDDYTFTFRADDDGPGGDPPVTATVVVRVVFGVSIRALASPVTEGGSAEFEVTASTSSAQAVELTVNVSGDVREASDAGARTVTIRADETTAMFAVPVRADELYQGDGAVTATVQAGANYVVGAPADATVTVVDDERAPTAVTLSVSPEQVNESEHGQTITVTAEISSGAPLAGAAIAVDVTLVVRGRNVGEDGAFLPDTTFLEVNTRTLSIEIGTGEPSGTAMFLLTTGGASGAEVWEGDGTVQATGTAVRRDTNGTLTVTEATVLVLDTHPVALEVEGSAGLTRQADALGGGLRFRAEEGAAVTLSAVLSGPTNRLSNVWTWAQSPGDVNRVLYDEATERYVSEVTQTRVSTSTLEFSLPNRTAPYTLNFTVTGEHRPGIMGASRSEEMAVAIEVTADDDLPVISDVEVVVGAVPHPIAHTGGTVKVAKGAEVTIRGEAVDPDSILTSWWSGPPGIRPSSTGPGNSNTFTTLNMVGPYTFTFNANNEIGPSGTPLVTHEVVVRVVLDASVRALTPSVTEGEAGAEVRIEVALNEAPTADFTVGVSLSGGGAFGIPDEARRDVTIRGGQATHTLTWPVPDDQTDSPDGTLVARIVADDDDNYRPSPSGSVEARVMLIDNDEATPDVNDDGSVTSNDALILYYAFSLRSELGNGR